MLVDRLQRPLEDLRISVTDRCNFRCTYCMPLAEYEWIHKSHILTFEEVARVARVFADLGVRKIRLTGGEPLVRVDLPRLVAQLAAIDSLEDLCLTTNGALLGEQAQPLADAGLRRVTVSLDTLRPERFREITQRGDLEPVIEGIAAAKRAGLDPIKINAVIERGVNEDEILDLVDFALRESADVRFIEFMDVGNANHWNLSKLVPKKEILDTIATRYRLEPATTERGGAPAVSYRVEGAVDIGVIASVTEPFCGGCTRARLTADGKLVTCLFSDDGFDLRSLLRESSDDAVLSAEIKRVWTNRQDRFSEHRLSAMDSSAGYQPAGRRKIEMIRLGG